MILANACVRGRGLEQGILRDRVIGKLLEHAFEPFDRLGEIALLNVSAPGLKYRIRDETAAVILIDYRCVVNASMIEVAIELINSRTPEMFIIGERRCSRRARFQTVE